MHRLKVLLGNALIMIGGPLFVRVIEIIGKSQLSGNMLVRGLGYAPSCLIDYLLGLNLFRKISSLSHRMRERKKPRGRIRNKVLRAYLNVAMSSTDEVVKRLVDVTRYRQLIATEQLDAEDQYALGHQLFRAGRLGLACETFADLIERSLSKLPLELRLQLYRDCGITHFMYGRNREANSYWARAGKLKRFMLGPEEPNIYRIAGTSWFAAIGHVAMLDFYIKYILLFRGPSSRTVIQLSVSKVPGAYLLSKFKAKGIVLLDSKNTVEKDHDQWVRRREIQLKSRLTSNALEKDHDQWAISHGMPLWNELTSAEQFARIDDFWEFEFPDGSVLGYTHAAARIQQEWERRGLHPLLSITEEEQEFISSTLDVLGVPKGAWYVCLHVREPGFHQQWNALYPSMRDAEIDDYRLAIEKIVAHGGWVIRMGDPTMKRLPEIPGVVDYAHSPLKTPIADILIPLSSRFFLGTNSGLATIPAIYGIRCAFTNWVPIGLPLWSSQDLMIPKLFWHEEQQRYLSLEEIFKTGLAFIQNWNDLPSGITLIKNTPEDIQALTEEMLDITANDLSSEVESAGKTFHPTYRRIAERHGSYVGSHLGSSFIKRHRLVFLDASVHKDE